MDNQEVTNQQPPAPEKKKLSSTMIDGVNSQVSLGPGSDTHRRFAALKNKVDPEASNRDFVEMLMNAYEAPHTDNSEVIANLEKQVAELKAENASYAATQQNDEEEIAQLKLDLATARREANENATKAQSIELAQQGTIIIRPNPVVAYFLQEMAEKTGKTPADILQALYIDDLQNPRANNLPYTVASSRIREVMEDLKKKQ